MFWILNEIQIQVLLVIQACHLTEVKHVIWPNSSSQTDLIVNGGFMWLFQRQQWSQKRGQYLFLHCCIVIYLSYLTTKGAEFHRHWRCKPLNVIHLWADKVMLFSKAKAHKNSIALFFGHHEEFLNISGLIHSLFKGHGYFGILSKALSICWRKHMVSLWVNFLSNF